MVYHKLGTRNQFKFVSNILIGDEKMNEPTRKCTGEFREFMLQCGTSYHVESYIESFPRFAEYFKAIPNEEINGKGFVHEIVLEEYMGSSNIYRLFWFHAVKNTLREWMSEEEWEQKCKELEDEISKEELKLKK